MNRLTLGKLWRIAFRDLQRNRRRSLLTLVAVAIGLTLLIFGSGLMYGGIEGALENGIRLQTGHLQIRAATYEEDKVSLAWEDLVSDPETLAAEIAAMDGVRVATPLLVTSGIVGARKESLGVRVFGIDPVSEASLPYQEGLVAGEYLDPDDRDGLYVGERLAQALGLSVGDSVSLMVSTADAEPDEAVFEIRGLYNTGVLSYDETTVFLALDKARAFTRVGKRASMVFVLTEEREDAERIAGSLRAPGRQVVTWRETNELLLSSVEQSAGIMQLMNLIVLAVVAVVIANTLLMAVFERTREMGILAALGMKGHQILSMFMMEAFTVGMAGIILGVLIGWGVVTYIGIVGWDLGEVASAASASVAYGQVIYTQFSLADALSLSTTGLVIILAAALYPSLIAARLEPIDALRAL